MTNGTARPTDIVIDGVAKRFGNGRASTTALDGIGLTIAQGEFVSVIGPSGCGKSTLLRVIAGLEEPSDGAISIGGVAPADLAAQHRLGVAFQDHALLPWLDVTKNVSLPFRIASRPVDRARVAELIALVGLAGFERSRPKHLSGGMRQRASIARALALSPEVLLLDEPFGALDAVTRRRLNRELEAIWTRTQVTTLLITHDVEEAVLLSDRVVVMTPRPGRIRHIETIDLARPRSGDRMRQDGFHHLVDRLTAMLDEDDAP